MVEIETKTSGGGGETKSSAQLYMVSPDEGAAETTSLQAIRLVKPCTSTTSICTVDHQSLNQFYTVGDTPTAGCRRPSASVTAGTAGLSSEWNVVTLASV